MDTRNTPYSIKKPVNWDLISEYTNGGAKPDAALAEKVLNELLENIKLSNCDYFEDVCNAILTRVPGKIEAENYGHDGFNRSYYVIDTVNKSKFYRKNEPVQVKLDSWEKEQFWSEQSIELRQSEWVVYTFECLDDKKYNFILRSSTSVKPSRVMIVVNGKKATVDVTSIAFSEVIIGDYKLNKGNNTIKLIADSGTVKIDWINIH